MTFHTITQKDISVSDIITNAWLLKSGVCILRKESDEGNQNRTDGKGKPIP